jgi:hypothetical protein
LVPLHEFLDGRRARETQDFGLVEGSLELAVVEGGGEVEEGSGRGGDRDPLVRGAFVLWETGAVRVKLLGRVQGPWDRDLDACAGRWADAPQRGRGVVAEHRPGTRGEHGGHPASALREGSVADGVDAAVHDVEPSAMHPPVDCAPSHVALEQLPAGHDPVLRAGQLRDEGVDGSRLRFAIYVMVKCRVDRYRPILALRACRVARESLQTCGALAR